MKIIAVTGSRADWGIMLPVLDLLRDDPRFDLEIIATGQHLMAGSPSLDAIRADGHQPAHLVDMGLSDADSPSMLAAAMGQATAQIGATIAASQPDLMLVLGDRYEILAAALAAAVARVPIAHLSGGDVTEGAIDDSIRHALSKLSALHFASNAQSAARLIQMGENPRDVHNVGTPAIDRILAFQPLPREAFFQGVGLQPMALNAVVTLHPATVSDGSSEMARHMLEALARFPDLGLIFTGSNADHGAREIDALIKAYVAGRANAVFHPSLGSLRYFSALRHCDLVIGNSSSGLSEAPSFGVPTVNIGDRQARRPRAESVIDCGESPDEISNAISRALSRGRRGTVNPFGDGRSAERIVAILAAETDPKHLIRKRFHDLSPV